jgi:hypothetical protein
MTALEKIMFIKRSVFILFGMTALAVALTILRFNSTAAHSAQAVRDNASPQWEYMVITAESESAHIQDYLFEPQLNKLGLEGWELAGTISEVKGDITHGHVILKRPRK